MPQTPPPYVDITGISRTVMKDNAQETLVNYDGNARPGEIVADLTTDPPALYVGNNAGQLTALSSGGPGTYGNANVAAYLPTYTGNLASLTGAVTTTANITANFFLGNGSQLTGIVTNYSNANVANYLPTYTGNLVSLTGNINTTASINVGNTIFANSVIRGRNYIVVDSDQPTEGGQLVLSYCNTTGMVGQANSTWNIDVDSLNSFRIMNQNGAGNVVDVIYASGANGNVTLSNSLNVPSGNVTGNYIIGTIAIRTTATTASGLPTAANAGAGARGFVTDADANTFNAPLVGGGANAVPVFSNGTGWFIG